MLCTVYHHLGDSWKWAREDLHFAASLFYNSISGVSQWFSFRLLLELPLRPSNLCIASVVALPFSSLQLNPSLATYLSLTSSQVEAIQQVIIREQHSLQPLMTALRTAREKLLAIGSEHVNEKQVKALADTEASLLARLIVANARMQSKIFNILSAEQQKKLSDLERTQSALTSEGK